VAVRKWFGDMPFTIDVKKGKTWGCKKIKDEEVDE